MSQHRFDRWARVVPVKPRDNIVSSQYTASPRFLASYENNKEVDMFCLMSHDYGKQWREEKDATKRVVMETHDHDFLMRRYVIRGYLNKRKELQTKPRFIMKQFQNIPAKIRVPKLNESTNAGLNTPSRSRSDSRALRRGGTVSDLGELTKDSLIVSKSRSRSRSKSRSKSNASKPTTAADTVAEEEYSDDIKETDAKQFFITCQKCCKKKILSDDEINKTEPIRVQARISPYKVQKEKTM